MEKQKLYMLLLGCKPPGRFTEQHDILFTIGSSLPSLLPDIQNSWPNAGTIHIDAWREITEVDGFAIHVIQKKPGETAAVASPLKLFFLNLGGYKPGEFEEFHYKMIILAENKNSAISKAKRSAFYKHTGFKGATAHIDDKYGVDVDDLYEIEDILPKHLLERYRLEIRPAKNLQADEWHLGYIALSKLRD